MPALYNAVMRRMQKVQIFTEKHPLLGPAFWILSFQYFIVQLLVASTWPDPYTYSWLNHTISDLGATICGEYGGRQVCSPDNALMNISFVIFGLTMFHGAMLIYHQFRKNFGTAIGFSFMAIAGFGTLLVGLFPENSMGEFHFVGALLAFLIGNLGVLILGLSLDAPGWLKTYSVLTGVVTLTALGLFAGQNYLGLGIGGMERLASYPQAIWMIVFGFYISEHRYRKRG